MTYSLIAKDPDTGAIGLIVASRFFACGARVPCVGARSAIASQAFSNPVWGTEGLRRLETGEAAQDVLDDLVQRDKGRAARQAHLMDATGGFAAYTGADCVDWAGHRIGDTHSVAGNMLTGPDVVDATFEAYAAALDLPFPERLMTAMEAGERAGGDKRGKQAAGLVIHQGQSHAWLDMRADDHADPLAELRRLYDVAAERYLHFAQAMPSEQNFSGNPDRAALDAAIAQADAQRKAEGRTSRSFASDPA
ncbi:DUF1028 domain-containing protein [Ruegeria sp.]|uniref:DUF1028 domain-containing protein n=1 Tax=Ruegeria sp. TaxID=1879320 RepID=UPI00230E3B45|nr:DUF1028 domain-containing protein [Ruegeria sp.]MDA7964400.1 DUF1028 domain-containing protein [Ruegeria sp.]